MKNIITKVYRGAIDLRLTGFLLLCLILGGTSQNIVTPKLPLYLISLFMIGLALVKLDKGSHIWRLKMPVIFLGLFIIIHFIYVLPLPPSIWTGLPGRENVMQGFTLLEMELPWLPLSLTPENTLFALFDFLPPLALLLMIGVIATAKEVKTVFWALPIFAAFTVLLGVAQVSGFSESLYFYDFTNENFAVGFFSNTNHQASFLLMALPFSVSLYKTTSRQAGGNSNDHRAALAVSILTTIFIILGILLTGSIAGYILMIPVLLISLFLCVSQMRVKKIYLFGVATLLAGGIIFDFVFLGNYSRELMANFNQTGQGSRQVMFATTYEAVKTYFPAGTGPGSFPEVYKMYGMPGRSSIPHAHNDFVETLLELGLVGIVLSFGFVLWWGKQVINVVRSVHRSTLLAKCVSLSMLSVVAHSAADYPLRTISLSTFFVFCLCVLVLKLDVDGHPSS